MNPCGNKKPPRKAFSILPVIMQCKESIALAVPLPALLARLPELLGQPVKLGLALRLLLGLLLLLLPGFIGPLALLLPSLVEYGV